MGILDKLKIKKSADKKSVVKKEKKPKAAEPEQKREAVVTPDGRLVSAPKKGEAKAKKAKPKKEDTGEAYRILMKPLITEKGSSLGAYNQYVFETDDGLVKIGPGKGFDNDVAAQLAPGVVYAITFLGKVTTNRGRTVNKYNVEEIGKAEYTETEPEKPAKSGKAVDAK